MARARLIQDKQDLSAEHHALFDELAALRGRISGPSTIVLHSPGLAGPWNDVGEYLHRKSIVEPRLAEIAVCATAREYDCPYVWAAHVPLVRKAGGWEKTLAAIRDGGSTNALPLDEARVVQYVRQLLQTNRVDNDLFALMVQKHGVRWLVELTTWIGRYGALAGILNAFELDPAAGSDPLPELERSPRSVAPDVLGEPRAAPITKREQVAENDLTFFDAVAEGRGSVRGPFSFLMYSPELCEAIVEVSDYLRHDSSLSAAHRELATVAVAREKECSFVWAAHAPAARNAGVAEKTISAVRQSGMTEALPAADAAIVEYVRQMLRSHRVTQTLFEELLNMHTIAWLVELSALIGHYGVITSILNVFEVGPAANAEKLM
jgi:4-carboxymuconolactone decarboxylase